LIDELITKKCLKKQVINNEKNDIK